MDIRAFDQGNSPISSKFYSTAIQNMQSNIASVKDNKDLKEEGTDPHDAVMLSKGMAEAADLAKSMAALRSSLG